MRHFFLDEKPNIGQEIFLNKEDSGHLLRVLRAKEGKKLSLAYEGRIYLGTLLGQVNDMAQIYIESEITGERQECPLILCQGVPKGQKLEEILKHCTEVGVDGFYPVHMERSVSDLRGKYANKKKRFEKIIEEAAKQANRIEIPFLGDLIEFKDLFSIFEKDDLIIACYEDEDQVDLEDISVLDGNRVFYLIGPEGGYSQSEIEFLRNRGVISVSLGKRILRTETASIVAGHVIKRKLEGVGL